MTIHRILIVGKGYVSQHLSQHIDPKWGSVCHYSLRSKVPFLPLLKRCNALLSTVPPNQEGKDPLLQAHQKLIQNAPPPWIGYLSSTSVYGDHRGEWVDESSPCNPQFPMGKRRLLAEKSWQQMLPQAHLFRLSGLYGPGRNALLALLNGQRYTLVDEEQSFSRIHVEDLITYILHSISSPSPGSLYNVSDAFPTPLHIVQQYAAQQIPLPPLREIRCKEAHLSPTMRQFFGDKKRISSRYPRPTPLRYPSYKEGLIHEAEALRRACII